MFESLESELKSASVRQCFQSWNGSSEIFLNAFNLGYKLHDMGAQDWGGLFEDWADICALVS